MFCRRCGALIADDAVFCRKCGTHTKPQQPMQPMQPMQPANPAMQYGRQAVAAARPVVTRQVTDFFSSFAADTPGEFSAGTFDDGIGNLIRSGMTAAQGVTTAGNSKKGKFHVGLAIVSALAMALLWGVQLIFMSTGKENIATTILNWLTFAKGGMGRNIGGMIGGLLGKGAVATAVAGICGGGFGALAAGFKRTYSGANFRKNTIGFMLIGIGLALMLYQFFTGEGTFAGAMAAVAGMLVTCRSLGGRAGMIFSMVRGLTAKKLPNGAKAPSPGTQALLGGLTMGFTLAIPVSLLDVEWSHLLIGGIHFIVGFILALAMGKSGTQVI